MLKNLIFCLFFTFPLSAHSQIINYVTPTQQELGTVSAPQIQNIIIEDDFMSDLDLTAANHGDSHAMGTLANSCLKKQDYSCAYKWSTIALKGSYWKQTGQDDKIKNIKDTAAEHLTPEEISNLDTEINEFKPR